MNQSTQNSSSNFRYLGNHPEKAPMMHPSYISFKHINPVLKAMSKYLTHEDLTKVTHGYRRSDFSQEALINDYLRGDVPKHTIIKDEHYYRALEMTTELFRPKETYRPVSFPDLRYYPWTLPTSAEAPYSASPYWRKYVRVKAARGDIENDRITFHNLYNEIFRHNREKVHRIKDGILVDKEGNDLKYWNQAHARSHLVKADDPDKIRMVFGVPKLLLMVECMFLWPLINDLLNRDSPMLWKYETLKGGWYAMHNWISVQMPIAGTYLALDWKQFDKRAQFEVIDDIHEMFRSYMTFENGYIPTHEYPESWTEPDRLESLWNWMCNAIKHTPDVLPNGDMYQRQHAGIASGFFQTQLLDSAYNCVILLTTLSKLGINITKLRIKVQGDDSIISILEVIPEILQPKFLEMFAITAEDYFGAILNTKKSQISSNLQGLPLLGFTNLSGFPTRPMHELLANLLYPERRSDENQLMARCVGIAFANCGYHTQVYKICENIFNYLKSKGFSPNKRGLPHLIQTMDNWMELFSLSDEMDFPSYYSTMSRLTEIPKRTQAQIEKGWPSVNFLYQY